MKQSVLIIFCALFFVAFSQNNKNTLDTISWSTKDKIKKIKSHVLVLASDSLEGREVGKRGGDLAADYISKYFEKINIPPISDSTYYQEFNLGSRKFDYAKIKVGNKRYFFGQNFYSYPKFRDVNILSKEIVFLGYGIESENYSDYNIDVQNKILLVLDGEPTNKDGKYIVSGTKKKSPQANYKEKLKQAKQRGAKALLIIKNNTKKDYKRFSHRINNPGVFLVEENSTIPFFFVDKKIAKDLLNTKSLDPLINTIINTELTTTRYLKESILIETKTKEDFFVGKNVLAFIEGSDPILKDEVVVITAHYDHIGIINGKIHNGADDNATGTAALLEVADAFQQAKRLGKKIKRSILVFANSAEEKGLLGSYYYVENPIFPLNKTIACLNVDMVGRVDKNHPNDSNYVYLIGSNKLSTDLHNLSEKTNKEQVGLNLDYTFNNPNDPNRFYYRSDHYNFAKKNIPSIFYFSGVHEDYHMHTDTQEKIIYEKVEKTARLIFYTAWRIANGIDRPLVDKVNDF